MEDPLHYRHAAKRKLPSCRLVALESPKTRLAPTPSGFLHLGNAFNLITTALAAHLEGAEVLLRVDDLDQARYRQEYADDIFQTLEFLGIRWDEGPGGVDELERKWSQKHRIDLYRDYLEDLAEKDLLLACECSRSDIAENSIDGGYTGACLDLDIPLDRADSTWRLKTDGSLLSISRWKESTKEFLNLPASMRHFIIRRRDGIPAYQLASVVDDVHFGVNFVVRGVDLYESTLAQLYLASKLEKGSAFSSASFLHHKLVSGAKGQKLSKSVLRQSNQLIREYNASEIFRQYSDFLSLSHSCNSLKDLKELVNPESLMKCATI